MNPFDLPWPAFLTLYLLLQAAAVILSLLLRRWLRKPSVDLGELPELSPYEIAYLTGGQELAVNAALTRLVDAGILDVDADQRNVTVRTVVPTPADSLEEVILQAAKVDGGQPIKDLRLAATAELSRLKRRLLELGLLVSDKQACLACTVPMIPVLSLIPFALMNHTVIMERDEPLQFIVMVVTMAALVCSARSVHRSCRGDLVWQRLREEYTALQSTAQHQTLTGIDLALAVAIYDLTILAGGRHANLQAALKPPQGASCCAGGGCGGGCGGCGGCGGGWVGGGYS